MVSEHNCCLYKQEMCSDTIDRVVSGIALSCFVAYPEDCTLADTDSYPQYFAEREFCISTAALYGLGVVLGADSAHEERQTQRCYCCQPGQEN
jgi:hypothetical protein